MILIGLKQYGNLSLYQDGQYMQPKLFMYLSPI